MSEANGGRLKRLVRHFQSRGATCQAIETAKRFHELYEGLAPAFGYKTRKASRVPWSKVPLRNRKLMVAVCGSLQAEGYLANDGGHVSDESEANRR